jgi:hypothetical protein
LVRNACMVKDHITTRFSFNTMPGFVISGGYDPAVSDGEINRDGDDREGLNVKPAELAEIVSRVWMRRSGSYAPRGGW